MTIQRRDAIVVGAGAAGLAAARRLARAAKRVVLIEARARAGGRVWPLAAVDGAGPGELGGEFIHGPAERTYALLRDAGLVWDGVEGERWAEAPGGGLEPERDEFGADAALFDGLDGLPQDVSVETFFASYRGDAAMQPRIDAARAFIEGFDAADPRIASARAIANEWNSGIDSTAARPRAGYGPMLDFLLAECAKHGVDMRLSTTVARIAWGNDGVTAEVRPSDGATYALPARVAVITLPAGVLRCADGEAPAFDPPLPAGKRRALDAIEMGNAIKVLLWFRTRFWERLAGGRYRDGAFFRRHGQTFSAFWTGLPRRDGPITAWVAGPRSAALRGTGRDALAERAVAEFGATFGEPELARRELIAAAAHDWHADPLARGAYSYVRTGGGDARASLGAPLGPTLYFAGEATAVGGASGTVEGALQSGERAAEEALRALAS